MNLKAWELRENETLLGSADASYIKMSMGIVLMTTDDKKYRMTGLFTNKLASALEQAGIKKS